MSAKLRSVQTTIWSLSKKFRKCDTIQKLLFLFLITNERTTLCGVYEMPPDEIALYTGIDYRNLDDVFDQLEAIGLAYYRDGWVLIPRYKANYNNDSVAVAIERCLSEIPPDIKKIYDSLCTDCDSNPPTRTRTRTRTRRYVIHEKTGLRMSETRYQNLIAEYGQEVVEDFLQRVADWRDGKGKHVVDGAATAANWMKRAEIKPKPKVVKVVEAPKLTSCPACVSGNVRTLLDEALCLDCGAAYSWKDGKWRSE